MVKLDNFIDIILIPLFLKNKIKNTLLMVKCDNYILLKKKPVNYSSQGNLKKY